MNSSQFRTIQFAGTALLMLGISAAHCAIGAPPATRPATAPTAPAATRPTTRFTPDVQKFLDNLLASKELHLTNGADSSATDFSARVLIRLPRGSGIDDVNFGVIRHGDHFAILAINDKTHLPFAYATRDLFTRLDPDKPGGLLLSESGHPAALFRTDGSKLQCTAGWYDKSEPGTLDIDPASWIRTVATNEVSEARLDPTGHVLDTVCRSGAKIEIALAAEPAAGGKKRYPIKQLVFVSPRGAVMALFDVQIIAPSDLPLRLTAADVKSLGLPIATFNADLMTRMKQATAPLTNDFGKNKAEVAAAEKLKSAIWKAEK